MADKPRLLVIEREDPAGPSASEHLAEHYDVVAARTMARALVLLREQEFAGVYVDTAQLSAVRWAGVMIQADEILDAIADGVAVVDPDLRVIWANPEFRSLADPNVEPIGGKFYRVLGDPEVLGPDPCPFTTAVASRAPASTVMRIGANRYLRVTVTPVFDARNGLTHLIALTRDITDETLQQQKINAIHKAGDELADLTPEELAEMGVEERTDLLKYNIARHMKDLLGLDFIEIRLLDRARRPARPAADRGDDAAGRQPRALRPQGGQRRDRVRRGDRPELPLPRHGQRPALPGRGRRGAQLADGPPDLPRHGHRHAQRRERPAQRLRRPRPPVPRDLRPQHRLGA